MSTKKHKPKQKQRTKSSLSNQREDLLTPVHQAFLDLLSKHFHPILSQKSYTEQLQQIKAHFYNRAYEEVFKEEESSVVYAVRYLPSRALAYADLFLTSPILDVLYPPLPRHYLATRNTHGNVARMEEGKEGKLSNVLAIGAGVGSEICATYLIPRMAKALQDRDDTHLEQSIHFEIIDHAPYGPFLESLVSVLNGIGSDDAGNGRIRHRYHRQDVLKWCTSPEFGGLLRETSLLTFMFVLNELFTASALETVRLIGIVKEHLPRGSHVLLVESAGELSQVKVGEEREPRMIYSFWDHLPGFECVLSEDRKWYRVNKELKYDLGLENMAYFIRLYVKT